MAKSIAVGLAGKWRGWGEGRLAGASTGAQVTPGRAAAPGADDPVQKYADSRIDRDRQTSGCS